MIEWVLYSEIRPATEGAYQWRVPSVPIPGLVITFVACMRERGAGLDSMLSPAFDYWDGYRVHVPAGTEWRDIEPQRKIRSHDYEDIQVNAAEISRCPFCRTVPKLRANESYYLGITIAAPPQRWNNWHLECCSWISSPRMDDPRRLIGRWNESLAAASPEEQR